MEQKNDRRVDELLASAAKAIGADKPDAATPQVQALVDKLSPEDMEKLRSILADKGRVQAIINSPQGQQLFRELSHQKWKGKK